MIIECSHCHAKYQYDEERFERRPSKKIRCAKCQQVFDIQNPAFAPRIVMAESAVDATQNTKVNLQERWAAKVAPPEETTSSSAPIPKSTREEPVPRLGSAELKLPDGKRLSLAIIDGPDAGIVFRIEEPRVTIGRSGADLVLNDSECSRVHAAVEIHDDRAIVEDLGSKNGTFYSETRITEPVDIWSHSEFRVGISTLMLIVTDEG